VVAARERSLDSLRATLESTKHFLEERLAQANNILATKETEVHPAPSLSLHPDRPNHHIMRQLANTCDIFLVPWGTLMQILQQTVQSACLLELVVQSALLHDPALLANNIFVTLVTSHAKCNAQVIDPQSWRAKKGPTVFGLSQSGSVPWSLQGP